LQQFIGRMKRKHLRWWLAVMLPGFLLRAMIPIGFMPMVGPGNSIQLVICEAYAPVPMVSMSAAMQMDPGMSMPVNSGSGVPAHQDHGDCPYGSSPALGALPSVTIPIAGVARTVQLAMASPQIAHFGVLPRAQSPRGPPV
jgi:hypothetical protein